MNLRRKEDPRSGKNERPLDKGLYNEESIAPELYENYCVEVLCISLLFGGAIYVEKVSLKHCFFGEAELDVKKITGF